MTRQVGGRTLSHENFMGGAALCDSVSCKGWGLSVLGGLCPRWRRPSEDLLNDLPLPVWLAFEDDYVAAFGGDFCARRDGG